MSRLKAFGTILHSNRFAGTSQARAVVAATSQKAAAEALGMKLSEFRGYACETYNPAEIDAAMSAPGVVFIRALDDRTGKFIPKEVV